MLKDGWVLGSGEGLVGGGAGTLVGGLGLGALVLGFGLSGVRPREIVLRDVVLGGIMPEFLGTTMAELIAGEVAILEAVSALLLDAALRVAFFLDAAVEGGLGVFRGAGVGSEADWI